MCLIVDANLASRVFGHPPEEDFLPVLDWLGRDGCLVVGGHLATELGRLENVRRFVLALLRAGRARQLPDREVEQEEAGLRELCQPNDGHVVALARVSGARTLCTHDRALQGDFRNPHLISRPRGFIYQRREHAHLLKHSGSCGRLKRR